MTIDVGQVAEIIVHVTEFSTQSIENFKGDRGDVGPAGLGVPPGGLIYEVLVKLSGDDNDTEWSDSLVMTTVTFKGEYDNGNSGIGKVIDFSLGQKQKITLNGNCSLVFGTPPGVGNYQLRLIQDATGNRAVSFSGLSGSRWLGATSQPDLNNTANGETLLSLYWDGAAFTQSLIKVGAR